MAIAKRIKTLCSYGQYGGIWACGQAFYVNHQRNTHMAIVTQILVLVYEFQQAKVYFGRNGCITMACLLEKQLAIKLSVSCKLVLFQ